MACAAVVAATALTWARPASAASTLAGAAAINPIDGGTDDQFVLILPNGAACSGDSATGGYLVYSYIVPASVAPTSLTFNSDGPVTPSGTSASDGVYPLYDTTGSAYVAKNTAVSTGVIAQPIPPFVFDGAVGNGFDSTVLAPGDYNVGIACAKSGSGDKVWNGAMTISADATDPGGFHWSRTGATLVDTTTTLAVSPAATADQGATVTFTATLTPANAVGSVTFLSDNGFVAQANVVAGTATASSSLIDPGIHQFKATFTPTDPAAFRASESAAQTYKINETSVPAIATTSKVTVSPALSAPRGSSVSITAAVTPTAALGRFHFLDGATELAVADALSGSATYQISTLQSGTHSFVATFEPTNTSAFGPSTSPAAEYTISASGAPPATVGITVEAVPDGTKLQLTARLTPPTAKGTISFLEGTTFLGSAPAASGSARFTTTSLGAGDHAVSASFSPESAGEYTAATSAPVTAKIAATAVAAVAGGKTSTAASRPSSSSNRSSGQAGGTASLPSTGFKVLPYAFTGALVLVLGTYLLRLARNRRISWAMASMSNGARIADRHDAVPPLAGSEFFAPVPSTVRPPSADQIDPSGPRQAAETAVPVVAGGPSAGTSIVVLGALTAGAGAAFLAGRHAARR